MDSQFWKFRYRVRVVRKKKFKVSNICRLDVKFVVFDLVVG